MSAAFYFTIFESIVIWICSCGIVYNIGFIRGMNWTKALYERHG